MMLKCAVGSRHVRQTRQRRKKERGEKGGRERGAHRAQMRYFVCIELTHVTIVKSPWDTWLPFRRAPVLCVIHAVIEESLLLAWVSPNKKKWTIFFFQGCGFCLSGLK